MVDKILLRFMEEAPDRTSPESHTGSKPRVSDSHKLKYVNLGC